MRRRTFCELLASAAACSPLAAQAQSADRMRRIGVLHGSSEDIPGTQARLAAFQEGLQQLGWIDGSNVRIDYRWGVGNADDTWKSQRNSLGLHWTSSWSAAALWSRCFRRPVPCRSYL